MSRSWKYKAVVLFGLFVSGMSGVRAETLAELNHIVRSKICSASNGRVAVPDPHKDCPDNYDNPCPASVSVTACYVRQNQCMKQFEIKLQTVLRYNAFVQKCEAMAAQRARSSSAQHRSAAVQNQTARPDELTFNITSTDQYAVQASFYSQDRKGVEWPGGGQAYTLADSALHSWTISCQPGERICYGAWRRGRTSIYWGSGVDDSEACTGCCVRCGSGTKTVRLVYNGGSNDGGGSSVPDFSGYIARNTNTLRRSQGSNPVHSTRPTPAPVQRSGGSRGTCPPVCTAQ